MAGAELLRRLRKLGRTRGVAVGYDAIKGKGSHGKLHFDDQWTTMKDPRKDISRGLLGAMPKDLGLTKEDLP